MFKSALVIEASCSVRSLLYLISSVHFYQLSQGSSNVGLSWLQASIQRMPASSLPFFQRWHISSLMVTYHQPCEKRLFFIRSRIIIWSISSFEAITSHSMQVVPGLCTKLNLHPSSIVLSWRGRSITVQISPSHRFSLLRSILTLVDLLRSILSA